MVSFQRAPTLSLFAGNFACYKKGHKGGTVKKIIETFGIALCGLITSVLVAVADVVIARMTTFDLFTLSVWVVVPVGAGLTGFAAASGYYFGSLYFHKKANASLFMQMVVIAGFAQFLIYYLGYTTLVLDDGQKASALVSFTQYLDISLTKAHYRFGRGQHDMGEAGTFGYWMAALQFVGFLLGGVFIFFMLKAKPVCGKCDLYLRPLSKKEKTFSNSDEASAYFDVLFKHPVDGPEFAQLIKLEAKVKKPAQGAVLINTALHSCPSCSSQMIEEKLKVFNGKEWKDVNKLDRRINIPDGINLAPVFRA